MDSLIGKVVVFTSDITDITSIFKSGMYARILDIKKYIDYNGDMIDTLYKFTFDTSEFIAYNEYYSTYKQSKVVKTVVLYFGDIEEDNNFFYLADDKISKLIELYSKEKTYDSYITWLEEKLIEVLDL